jgi:NodT family efflux transporter outer membrane factor (OMF) lipoprotein
MTRLNENYGVRIMRRIGIITIVAWTIMLLSACTVGPNYVRPSVQSPPAYKEAEGGAKWQVARPQDDVIRGAWWELFNDPQLNALEVQVAISNQNIAQAEAQYRQAQALVQAARAGYFPTVGVNGSATRTRAPFTGGGGSSSSSSGTSSSRVGAINNFLVSGNATWEPDIWGKVRRTVEANEASAQASAADIASIRLSAQSALAQDYFQLCMLDAQKKFYAETVSDYQKFLALTKNRYAAGVASSADVLVAETQLKTTQAQAIDLGVQRAQMEHAIAMLVGKAASVFSIPETPLSATPPPIPLGVPSVLLQRRPDIASAERLAAAANAQIGVAEAAYYPNITLSATGGFESSKLSNWLTWPNRLWSIGTTAAETVFDAGLRSAQTAQARAAYDASVAAYRQTVLTGFQEVEDDLSSLRILAEEAQVQDEAVKAAKQSVIVSTNQYKAGIIGAIDIIAVQAIALNDERTAIGIAGQRMTASVLLISALGGGWDASELKLAGDGK